MRSRQQKERERGRCFLRGQICKKKPRYGLMSAGFGSLESANFFQKKRKRMQLSSCGSVAPCEENMQCNERLLSLLSQMTLDRGLSPAGPGGTCQGSRQSGRVELTPLLGGLLCCCTHLMIVATYATKTHTLIQATPHPRPGQPTRKLSVFLAKIHWGLRCLTPICPSLSPSLPPPPQNLLSPLSPAELSS